MQIDGSVRAFRKGLGELPGDNQLPKDEIARGGNEKTSKAVDTVGSVDNKNSSARAWHKGLDA